MRHDALHNNAGAKAQPAGYSFRTDDYPQFQVIVVYSGEIEMAAGGANQNLGPGAALVLREGSAFTLRCRRQGYRGLFYIAAGDLPAKFRGPAVAMASTAEMLSLTRLMQRSINQPCPQAAEVLAGLGRALAWETLGALDQGLEAAPAPADWVAAACNRIEATLYAACTPREALATLPLSYRQLTRHFQAVLGVSPKRYQLAARIREAGRLLGRTRMSVTDIAMELGYSSSQHLAAQFLAETGQSPTAFRRSAAKAAGDGVQSSASNVPAKSRKART